MKYRQRNMIDGTTFEFPGTGFWLIHLLGSILIFIWGMRYAVRRAPFPLIGYRFFKMLMRH